jgi:uncharacterized protein YfaQ (DUF2300 family)
LHEGNLLGARAGQDCAYPILEGQPPACFINQVKAFQSKRRTTSAGVMHLSVANLSDRQVAELAAFFGGKQPQQAYVHSARASAGRTRLDALHCDACHGPRLAGQGSAHSAEAADELPSLSEEDVVNIAHALAAMN